MRISEDGHIPEYESAIDLMAHPSLCLKYMERAGNSESASLRLDFMHAVAS